MVFKKINKIKLGNSRLGNIKINIMGKKIKEYIDIKHMSLIYDGRVVKDEEMPRNEESNYMLMFVGGEGRYGRVRFNNNKVTQQFNRLFKFEIGSSYGLILNTNFIAGIRHGSALIFYHGSYIVFYSGISKKFIAMNEFTIARKHILKNRLDQATMYHFLSEFCKKHNLEIEDFFKPII